MEGRTTKALKSELSRLLLLRSQNCIFRGFGHAKLENFFLLESYRFPSLWFRPRRALRCANTNFPTQGPQRHSWLLYTPAGPNHQEFESLFFWSRSLFWINDQQSLDGGLSSGIYGAELPVSTHLLHVMSLFFHLSSRYRSIGPVVGTSYGPTLYSNLSGLDSFR